MELFDVDNVIAIGNDINDSIQRFALLPHHMMSLVLLLSQSQSVSKTLKLLNTAIPVDSFSILGNYFESTNSNINCLYLKNNYLQPSSARTIGNIIKKNCLETLKVTDNHLRHGSIGELSVALPMNYSIHYLTLNNASLKSDDICMLINALTGKDIQFLDISDNYCGSKGAKSVALFVHTNKMLRSLDVSKNLMALSDQGIQCCRNATVSQYSSPEDICDDWAGIASFFDAVKSNPNITSLYLSNILFLDNCCYQLVSAFQQSRKLLPLYWASLDVALGTILALVNCNELSVSLNISDNGFGDHVVCKWFNALLYNNTTLKLLDISDNRLQAASAKIILHVLQCNCTLTCLALGSNKINDKDCQYLAEALSVNKTITSLYI